MCFGGFLTKSSWSSPKCGYLSRRCLSAYLGYTMICSTAVSWYHLYASLSFVHATSTAVSSVSLAKSPAWIVEKFVEQAPDAAPDLLSESGPMGITHTSGLLLCQFESLLRERDIEKLNSPSRPLKKALSLRVNAESSTSYILDSTRIKNLAYCTPLIYVMYLSDQILFQARIARVHTPKMSCLVQIVRLQINFSVISALRLVWNRLGLALR